MGTNLPSASTYSNRKCCIVQTGIFPLTYQCNKYNLLKTWVVFHWTGAVLEAVLLAHRFNPLIKQPCYETFSSWQCWNPVISKDFDIPKKQIPGHVTEWNPPSFFRFRQRNRDRGWFHQIRESGFSFTCEAGGFTETETGTGFGFDKWITPIGKYLRACQNFSSARRPPGSAGPPNVNLGPP